MNEINQQQAPNLEAMDEREARRFLTDLLSKLDPEEEYSVRNEDYVMEMPQSGERIRGRERMREFQRAYPSPPHGVTIRLRRVLVREGLWIVEGVYDYDDGGMVSDLVMICELRDGKMWRDRWYFAEPFEAPAWRAQWVERMESGTLAR